MVSTPADAGKEAHYLGLSSESLQSDLFSQLEDGHESQVKNHTDL